MPRRCASPRRARANANWRDPPGRRDPGRQRDGTRVACDRCARRARAKCFPTCTEIAATGLRLRRSARTCVFVGGFRHPPNVDAVLWFAQRGVSRWSARNCPTSTSTASAAIHRARSQALSEHQACASTATCPTWTRPCDGMRMSVAPLRFGAGVKGKINLSMAHGQPVVATPTAVEGMHLRDGLDVLVADEAAGVRRRRGAAVPRTKRCGTSFRAMDWTTSTRHFSMDAARDVVRRVFFDWKRRARLSQDRVRCHPAQCQRAGRIPPGPAYPHPARALRARPARRIPRHRFQAARHRPRSTSTRVAARLVQSGITRRDGLPGVIASLRTAQAIAAQFVLETGLRRGNETGCRRASLPYRRARAPARRASVS